MAARIPRPRLILDTCYPGGPRRHILADGLGTMVGRYATVAEATAILLCNGATRLILEIPGCRVPARLYGATAARRPRPVIGPDGVPRDPRTDPYFHDILGHTLDPASLEYPNYGPRRQRRGDTPF